ncbi:dihydrolipoyl dehydrogenase family protein [Georgenia faecalis]|uniref:Dihydrolipoyl dehydrogenase family protein n=1 Tax=Georgenia faecalis TaxID=2483799 RepID=A0ABV9DCM0_9MICO|nr:NAD(P)/FAD-dependent oxidoreductase [Georgenia faecalis]
MPERQVYDVVVIGAGPVGENVADRAVRGGLSAVIVESELVGGECSYWACIPSKALLRSGDARRAALRVDGARQAVTGGLDAAAVLARRDSFVGDWDDAGQVSWLESAGIDLVRGHGRLTGPREVTVTTPDGEVHLAARHAVALATGTRAHVPDTFGLRAAQPWTNREGVAARVVPESLAVIGGGAVACELAGAWADLGSAVTMLVRHDLLAGYEPFAAELVGKRLEERGVTLRRGVSARRVEREAGGAVVLECDDGSTLRVAEVLVATGREPRTDDLGLGAVGLGSERGWLDVDETLRVLGPDGEPVEWLYAVGDINHRNLLTHQGKYQARAAGDVIAARAQGGTVDDAPWGVHAATADHRAVTQVVFTDPQVASAGLTAAAADEAGYRTRVVEADLGAVSGASLHADGYVGRARMVVDEDRGVVLGATFVGQDVAELLFSAAVAVAGEVPLDRLWHAVPPFPTSSEVWLRLLEAYGRPVARG